MRINFQEIKQLADKHHLSFIQRGKKECMVGPIHFKTDGEKFTHISMNTVSDHNPSIKDSAIFMRRLADFMDGLLYLEMVKKALV